MLSRAPPLWHCNTCFAYQQINNLIYFYHFVLGALLARGCSLWLLGEGYEETKESSFYLDCIAHQRPGGSIYTHSKLQMSACSHAHTGRSQFFFHKVL